jgi:hypothetical protein
MRKRPNWLLFGLGVSIVFCLALTDGTIYPLGTLRTVFLQRDGGNTLTGDTFNIANGAADDFTLLKGDGAGLDGDVIIKTQSTADNSLIVLDNDSTAGPQFKQNGTQVGAFTGVTTIFGGKSVFALAQGFKFTSTVPHYIVSEDLRLVQDFSGGIVLPITFTISEHTITGNPSARLGSDGTTDMSSSLRVQGASVYYADPATVLGYGPKVDVFSAEATGPGTNFIAGDGGIQSNDVVSIRTTDATKAVAKFVRGTIVEWRIDSVGDWVDVAGGNLVDTVDVGAHTHVGGGSNGAALGTASVGATQITDTLCLASVFTTATAPSVVATSYSAFGDTGSLLNGATESTQQVLYLGAVLAHSLRVKVSVAPAGVTSWAVTLRDDGVDTALTCTITGAATTCADTTNAPSIGAGSLMTLKIVPAGGVPAATSMYISACTGQ